MKLPRRKTFRAVCDGATALALAIIAGVLLCCALAKGAEIHPAVVRIENKIGNQSTFGTGALIDVDEQYGWVLTCAHVLDDGTGQVSAYFVEHTHKYYAEVVGVDRTHDLSLLAIRVPQATPLPVAEAPPQIGESVVWHGFGRGTYRVAQGVAMKQTSFDKGRNWDVLEWSGGSRDGDSGGPVLNDRGELVAVLAATDDRSSVGSDVFRVCQFLQQCGPYQNCRPGGGVYIGGGINAGIGIGRRRPPSRVVMPLIPNDQAQRMIPVQPQQPYQSPQTYPPQPSYPQQPPTQPPAQGSAPPARITPEDLQRLADLIAADGRLRGQQGEPGAPGIPGEPGPPGRDGVNGLDGTNGVNGKNGKDGRDADESRIAALEAEVAALKEAGVWLKVYDSPWKDARMVDQEFVRIGDIDKAGAIPIYRAGVTVKD